MVTIEMENGKKIKLELYPEVAPITVANFEKLAKSGFYDGLIFSPRHQGVYDPGRRPRGHRNGRLERKDQRRICGERN